MEECQDLGKDGDAQLFVNHKSEDSHHGGTSVVQFNTTLLELGFFIKGVPAEVYTWHTRGKHDRQFG